jgi:UPF0042 nucleotide-binding protein
MNQHPLSVLVTSFAYSGGVPSVPSDTLLYVIDCRTVRDPMWGEFQQYHGLAPELREHFQTEEPMQKFLAGVTSFVQLIIDQAREMNVSRPILIGFGCTHGRHRSVYCADMTASMLRERFDLECECTHRDLVV